MGKYARALGEYLSRPDRFADFCNGGLYGGEQVISERDLAEVQKAYNEVMRDRNGRLRTVGRERDAAKLLCKGSHFVLIAVENQARLNYCMPFRCMEYDVMDLAKQLRTLRNHYKRKGGLDSAEEYLSGMKKTDMLIPGVTIVFYHGRGKWEAPKQLCDMLDMDGMDPTLKRLLMNYRMRVICLDELKEKNFRTGLRELFGLMKRRDSKNAMIRYCRQNAERFMHVDEETYDVICSMLNLQELWRKKESCRNDGKEDFCMCKAFDEMVRDGERRGERRGEEKLGRLMEKLLQSGRTEEALQASTNMSLRRKLYREYSI